MNNEKLEIKTKIRILKPAKEVFEAIVDPAKMANYFISKGSARMEPGKELIWNFPEFDMDVPVKVDKTEAGKYISFYWDERDHWVEIFLEPDGQATIVTITEKGEAIDEVGIKWLMSNTEGWANFLACLKAWLEYGINLRKGAFDFLKKG